MKKKIVYILVLISCFVFVLGIFVFDNKSSTNKPVSSEPKILETPSINYLYHEFGDMEFGGFMITQIGDKYEMFFSFTNHGEDLNEVKYIDITLYDSKGKKLTTVSTELINLKKDETYQMILETPDDISSAYDFKVEYK